MGPDGWSEVRLGVVFAEVADRNNRDRLPVLAVTLDRGVVRRDSLGRKMDREVEQDAYLRALPGDIAYNTMRMWQGGSGLVREPGFVSPAYTVLRARGEECPEFWAHAFKAPGLIDSFRAFSQGVAKDRHRLYYDQFSAVCTLRPPLAEQRKIAAILSSVDETIGKTEAVIAQLDVVKKAMLEELLTRGIPGRHSRFKKTEIGEVPEEWSVARFGGLIGTGPTNGLYKPKGDYGSGVPIVRIDAFDHGDRLVVEDLPRVQVTPEELSRFSIANGDLLLNRVNSITHIGKCCRIGSASEPAVFESNMMRLRADPELATSGFLFLVLISDRARKHFQGHAKQAVAQASINQQDVASLVVGLPSRSEQAEVVEVMVSMDAAAEAERACLRRLRDSKETLSAALLSGDLRVVGG